MIVNDDANLLKFTIWNMVDLIQYNKFMKLTSWFLLTLLIIVAIVFVVNNQRVSNLSHSPLNFGSFVFPSTSLGTIPIMTKDCKTLEVEVTIVFSDVFVQKRVESREKFVKHGIKTIFKTYTFLKIIDECRRLRMQREVMLWLEKNIVNDIELKPNCLYSKSKIIKLSIAISKNNKPLDLSKYIIVHKIIVENLAE